MVSSKDVATKAGVSTSTVSRVFSNPDLVNSETKEKVLKIAQELNYVPDINARGLKLQKTNIIGVVISDINNSFYTYILQRIFKESSYHSFVVFSEENAKLEKENIYSLISSKVEGIIFTPTKYNKEIENLITNNNIPSIQLYRKAYEKLDSLVIDDDYGTYIATKELLENGHKNIVLVDYLLDIPTHREEGYIRAYQELNIPYNKDNIVKLDITKFNEKDYYQILDNLKFTGMITTSYIFSTSTLSYLKERNLKIYDDISLILYDDLNFASFMGLSAISHPLDLIASEVKDILISRITNSSANNSPIHRVIKPLLIKRNSIKNINNL